VADLDRDLAAKPGAGGSYFGLKELGRLATIAQVAQGVGAEAQRRQALDRLRPQLVDWLTYDGGGDGRYFAYDSTWGGLIAVPAEFGSNDYNDHHFQYGYLVRAAAVLGQADPAFRGDYGGAVDLVVREYAGALGTPGFPAFRVFNPYLGHSAASGFAPFADGNNQESSGEAVAAWEAVVRWGLVTDRPDLVTHGVTHYAMEAATARMYWLGQGITRPDGYAHQVAGIVWDAKIDYATFFDPKPESVEGIQLLPLTFGSLYRADAKAAGARSAGLDRATGGAPRAWGDLFAADLAAADPGAARDRLRPDLPREDSTSRAMVRYYVETLAAFGAPQPAVTADAPYGMAFGDAGNPTLVAVNPTPERQTVTFRSAGRTVATLTVEPGEAQTHQP
jgi:endo-1,3(4)-beta-glucanase